MAVIVYSTPTCPKCKVLKSKLQRKNIEYSEEQNIEVMQELGIMSVPCLRVDDELMDFVKANAWVNQQEDK